MSADENGDRDLLGEPEREQAVQKLAAAYEQGHLEATEYADRAAAARAATTSEELERLLGGLPDGDTSPQLDPDPDLVQPAQTGEHEGDPRAGSVSSEND